MAALRAFTMPKWGIEMQEGTLAEWLVAEGAAFAKGDLIALIETDKITNEYEAERDGVLARIVTAAGETKPVGALLGVFADGAADGADVDAFLLTFRAANTVTAAGQGASSPAAAPAAPAAAADPTPIAVAVVPPSVPDGIAISPAGRALAEARGVDVAGLAGTGRGGRITHQDVDQASRPAAPIPAGGPVEIVVVPDTHYASPLAKRLAAQHGVDLGTLRGTGPRGRICKADVLSRLAPASSTGAGPDIVPMDKIRRIVARRLTEAKQAIPHFYLRADATVDALVAMRRVATLVAGEKASINDCLVRAVALALIEVPDCNVQVHGDAIHRFRTADVAIAIAADRGLVTPVIRAAETLSVHAIAEVTRGLLARANAGRLSHEDMSAGSFTVSNLGMFGIDGFDAIINPPQGAILAVGGMRRVWGEQADGSGAFESRIGVTLSCNHRAIDGAAGARFLAALKRRIETPDLLFARP